MSQVNVIRNRVDEFDARSIRDMQETSAWKVYAAKIDGMILHHEKRCQDPTLTGTQVRAAQYALQ